MRNAQLLAAIAAILVTACDPSDWKPDAPPAPGCSEERPDLCEEFEPAACEAEDKPDSNKHGAKGQNTLHWANLQVQNWATFDNCNNDQCMANRWTWYGFQYVDVNATSRTRIVDSISYQFSWEGMPGHWDWLDANVIVCFGGHCPDVANSHSSTTQSWGGFPMRNGTTTFHRGMTWPAWGYGIFDIAVRLRSGAVCPVRFPIISITSVRYKDGP